MPINRAVVWDLDGVIVDSAEAQNASWVAMAQEFGVPYDAERDFKVIFGRHNTDIINSLWKVMDAEGVERMVDSKEGHFRRNATTLLPLPGVLELMDALQKAGWRQAIGSSAPMENVKLLVEVTAISPYIEAIASGDDVTEGKPNPQVFLLAFKRLGVEPRDGVVIEDAPAGIQAGLRAGAATLGVTNTQTEETLREAGAHMVVHTLAGMGVADFERLVEVRQRLEASD
jgi:beta-phosphoglucomutase